MTEHLDLEDLLGMIRLLGLGPVRDLGLVDSALARPRATAFGEELYVGCGRKAAALLHSLARNHALVDGNKRLAWLATVVFLDLNGWEVTLDDDEAFALVVDVARGAADVDDIVQRLRVAERPRER